MTVKPGGSAGAKQLSLFEPLQLSIDNCQLKIFNWFCKKTTVPAQPDGDRIKSHHQSALAYGFTDGFVNALVNSACVRPASTSSSFVALFN